MNRFSRHSDYYPAPVKYQYRYFNPTPVVPTIQGTDDPRTHTCGATAHDHGCHIWNAIGAKGGTVESQITAVRDHSLKKVLPWRVNPVKDVHKDTSFYTGRGLTYNGSIRHIWDANDLRIPRFGHSVPRVCLTRKQDTPWC
ncbi:unnamed protein product [Allacma fusca]|uniref:Uncharacterized protein n=1 Tax=Allacma fusca TaxID=39272 RepID=A0A8J2KFY4_9HEXA|nr:unnamed protein product [Allacma fusca]